MPEALQLACHIRVITLFSFELLQSQGARVVSLAFVKRLMRRNQAGRCACVRFCVGTRWTAACYELITFTVTPFFRHCCSSPWRSESLVADLELAVQDTGRVRKKSTSETSLDWNRISLSLFALIAKIKAGLWNSDGSRLAEGTRAIASAESRARAPTNLQVGSSSPVGLCEPQNKWTQTEGGAEPF